MFLNFTNSYFKGKLHLLCVFEIPFPFSGDKHCVFNVKMKKPALARTTKGLRN